MRTLLIVLFALTVSVPAMAQDAPKLTAELDLKRQILSLQVQLTEEQTKAAKLTVAYGQCAIAAVPKLDDQFAAFKADVEAANPGFSYEVETGKFTPTPKPVK